MSIEANKKVVAELYSEVYGRGDQSRLNELVSPDFVNSDVNGDQQSGRDGIPYIVSMLRNSFADLRCTVHELIGEGDNVVARVCIEGIHREQHLEVPPSGEPVRIDIIAIWRLQAGRLVGLHAVRRMSSGPVH